MKKSPEKTMIYLFTALFFLSFIQSFTLLGLAGGVVLVYALARNKNKNILRQLLPVLPFMVFLLVPKGIETLLTGDLDLPSYLLKIEGKVGLSAILLGTIVHLYSPLYLVDGLLNLGLPPILNQILALTFRYFYMVQADVALGRQAMDSRGMAHRKGLGRFKLWGEWIGGFFLKAAIHGEQVYKAMQARGFDGHRQAKTRTWQDLFPGYAVCLVLAIGLLVIESRFQWP